MNGHAIAHRLKQDPWARRAFVGVYARNTLTRVVPPTHHSSAFIVNTDRNTGPGQHWVAIWFDAKRSRAEYFDSYGLSPAFFPEIERFIQKHSTAYRYNNRPMQDVLSQVCGYYVLYFVLQKSRGVSLARIQQSFRTSPLYVNDRRVQRLVRGLY